MSVDLYMESNGLCNDCVFILCYEQTGKKNEDAKDRFNQLTVTSTNTNGIGISMDNAFISWFGTVIG